MLHRILSAALGAAVVILDPASANPMAAVVSGIYSLDASRSDDAFKAIDRGTAALSADKRPIARQRLRKSIAVHFMIISIAGNRVGIAYDAKAPIVLWLGEDPIKWKLTVSFDFIVSAKTDGEALSLTFHSVDGDRTTKYHNIGTNLVEDTVIDISGSATPIVYQRVYTNVNP